MKKLLVFLTLFFTQSIALAEKPLHPNDVLRQVPRGPGSVQPIVNESIQVSAPQVVTKPKIKKMKVRFVKKKKKILKHKRKK